MDNIIGIDVSKDTLDVHRLTDDRHNQFINDKTGYTVARVDKFAARRADRL